MMAFLHKKISILNLINKILNLLQKTININKKKVDKNIKIKKLIVYIFNYKLILNLIIIKNKKHEFS